MAATPGEPRRPDAREAAGPAAPALADAFRAAFAGHPAGVAIVTAAGPDGPAGITASSLISVSVEPPALAFSVAAGSASGMTILAAETLAVHLLTAANRGLAELFSTPGSRRFGTDMDWYTAAGGEPVIRGVGTVLLCRTLGHTSVGTGTLVAAEVVQVSDGGPAAAPLVYHARTYHGLGPWTALRRRAR